VSARLALMRRVERLRHHAGPRAGGATGSAQPLPRSHPVTPFDFSAAPIRMSVYGRSDPGRQRAENQDDFLVADLSASDGNGCLLRPEGCTAGDLALREFTLGPKGALILVADGMGGAAAGALASRLAATFIHQQ